MHVRAARAAGYRSRSAYKLLEIDKAHRLLARGMRVADLGAAPGGWSQVLAKKAAPGGGAVVAVDVLAFAPLTGVIFIQGDFTEPAVQQQIREQLGDAADIVVSDMAPDLSGIAVRDQAQAQMLFAAALDYCRAGGLKAGGDFLIKTFAGEMHGECRRTLNGYFSAVCALTPAATRKNSRECYLLGRGFTAAD